jgi:hypothetical protein
MAAAEPAGPAPMTATREVFEVEDMGWFHSGAVHVAVLTVLYQDWWPHTTDMKTWGGILGAVVHNRPAERTIY